MLAVDVIQVCQGTKLKCIAEQPITFRKVIKLNELQIAGRFL